MQVYEELCQAIDEWMVIMEEESDPFPEPTASGEYSGRFVLRIDSDLHKLLASEVLKAGERLNSYCTRILKERHTAEPIRSRKAS